MITDKSNTDCYTADYIVAYSNTTDSCTTDNLAQYSLGKIVVVWALATGPMACLAWVVVPNLLPHTNAVPTLVFWSAIIVGMAWQFVLAVILLHQEGQRWTWTALKDRLWLNCPRDPATGVFRSALYWSVLGGVLFVGLTSDLLGDVLDAPFRALLHISTVPAYADIHELIAPQFAGLWILLPMALLSSLFNYVLGEALLFHGVLLPRMTGVFGRWAWLANAVVFGLYHLHLFWQLPSIIVSNMAYSWTAQRYRSVWLAIFIHGFEGVVLILIVSWVVLGGPVAGLQP